MGDQTVEMFPQICKDVVLDHDSTSSSTSGAVKTLETITTQLDSDVSNRECTPDIATEPADGDSDLIGESSTSKGTEEGSPGQMVLPVLQKITDLTTEIQDLKREHTALSVEVKLTTNSFPDPAVLNTIQLLSIEHELLKKKYLDELSERKRLYNEMIELKGNIRVFCRCRPLNQTEISSGSGSVVEFESSLDNELQVICSDSSIKTVHLLANSLVASQSSSSLIRRTTVASAIAPRTHVEMLESLPSSLSSSSQIRDRCVVQPSFGSQITYSIKFIHLRVLHVTSLCMFVFCGKRQASGFSCVCVRACLCSLCMHRRHPP